MLGNLSQFIMLSFSVYSGISSVAQPTGPDNIGRLKPNIIFILTDDQRWDALGIAGNAFATTPEMDKLAASGTYFKKALVTTPICAASRASIISGLYERTHKYTFQTAAIRSEYMHDAYPNLLRKAGYYTGFFGKFGVKYDKLKSLFDVADDYDRNVKFTDKRSYFYKTINNDTVHLTRYTGQQGLDFIKNAPANKPFCLQLSFSAPHAQDNAPDQYFWQAQTDDLYQHVSMPAADLGDDKYFNALPDKVKSGFSRLRWTWRFDTPEKYQRSVKGYYRMIAEIDLEIAKIRELLQKKGLDKNTIIIVMGDNGYFLGERQIADKWLMYDQSVRVPLIVFDPRVNKHIISEQQALNIDIPATIADAAGLELPASWHGKSLLPLVSGKTKSLNRDTVLIEHLWEFEEIPPSEGLRTDKWKYFRYVNDKSIEELYNLEIDPREINNLANDPSHLNLLNSFQKKLDELILKHKDPYSGLPRGLMTNFDNKHHRSSEEIKLSFSWTIPKEAVSQLGYQVLVASSKENIDNNIGDLWDSKQVRADSSNTEYKGGLLKGEKRYYWKLRIWDRDNRLTDYSGVQSFRRSKQN